MTIMASGMLSRIDCRCAARASAVSAFVAAKKRDRRSNSPRHETPMPTTVKLTTLTMSAAVSERKSTTKKRPNRRPSNVARRPGPQPLNAEATRIAGRKNR